MAQTGAVHHSAVRGTPRKKLTAVLVARVQTLCPGHVPEERLGGPRPTPVWKQEEPGPPRTSRTLCLLAGGSLRGAGRRAAGRWQGRAAGRSGSRRTATPTFPRGSLCLFFQSESEEKVVTYDHIGPNVCMGDHKVTCPCCVWLEGGGRGPGWGSSYGHTALAELVCVYLIAVKYHKVGR